MTMQSDRDAALCERLRARVLPGRISEMSDGTRALDPLCQSAADRLESLSRQLSEAEKNRLHWGAQVEALSDMLRDLEKSAAVAVEDAEASHQLAITLDANLAEARRERDELRAAVDTARGTISALAGRRYDASDPFDRGTKAAREDCLDILNKHIPDQTEGSKP